MAKVAAPRISVVIPCCNEARHIGVQHAAGEIIARRDGHAQPSSDYLTRCLTVLTESGADVVVDAWDWLRWSWQMLDSIQNKPERP